jgi:hypothetical protein
MHIKSSCASK